MIGHLLNTDVTVYRSTYAADGAGGRTELIVAADTLRAMVSQPTDMERQAAAQLGSRLDFIVHVANGADVQRGDEIDTGGDRRLRIIAVTSNSRETYTRLHCTVVQGE